MTKEEAIKVIKEALPTLWKETKDAIQTLIPELAESEDERIRKELLQFFHQALKQRMTVVPEDNYKRWIAYLEKQKINTEGDFGRGYNCGYEACLNSHGAEWFEKQKEQLRPDKCRGCNNVKGCINCVDGDQWAHIKEQKPAEDWREKRKKECPFRKADGCERYADVISECTGNCSWVVDYPKLKEIQDRKEQKSAECDEKNKDKPIPTILIDALKGNAQLEWALKRAGVDVKKLITYLKQKEQQPAEWSDSFEENIRNLLHDKLTWHSEDGSMSSTTIIDDKTLKDIISGIWFYVGKEALKYPNKELNATEWSEEDEENISKLHRLLVCCETEDLFISSAGCNKLHNWLKSLRPQPHWKPSEEQMEAFKDALVELFYWHSREEVLPLKNLFDDLKKL